MRDNRQQTSWNKVADWYDHLVGERGSDYHQNVIIPGAIRMLLPKKGEKILDIACGQGVLCREMGKVGADVTGVDSSIKLIDAAKKRSGNIQYRLSDATNLAGFNNETFDAVTCIMAVQNMDPLDKVVAEAARVLKKNGRYLIVLSHPCFRIPRQSGWGFDEKRKLQYRRIDSYLSSQKIPIQMHPGQAPGVYTWTFHRPLMEYFKALNSNGLAVTGLEEWITHRRNQPGKGQKAENRSRDEIPLFMALAAKKN